MLAWRRPRPSPRSSGPDEPRPSGHEPWHGRSYVGAWVFPGIPNYFAEISSIGQLYTHVYILYRVKISCFQLTQAQHDSEHYYPPRSSMPPHSGWLTSHNWLSAALPLSQASSKQWQRPCPSQEKKMIAGHEEGVDQNQTRNN